MSTGTETRPPPELVLPAGDLQRLEFALRYGADAIYVGAAGLSMRPDQVAFSIDELAVAVERVHCAGKRLYVAANVLLFADELPALERWLVDTRDIPIDGLILGDLGGLALARDCRPELPLHVSTQMSTANHRAARVLADLGVARVVLARECTLEDTAEIVREAGLEVEVFVHGAMCVAVSGRCLLSAHLVGSSGNQGECKQTCRWEWQLVEKKRPGEALPVFEAGQRTILLGSTDLCMIEHLPALLATGVHALKVEGRMKSAYHVATVARAYRAALDAYGASPGAYRFDPAWLDELHAVSHRPFSTGFAFGYPHRDPASLQTPNRPVSTCELVGYVDALAEGWLMVRVKNPVCAGDELEWIGPASAAGRLRVDAISDLAGAPLERATSTTLVKLAPGEGGDLPPVGAILRRRYRPCG